MLTLCRMLTLPPWPRAVLPRQWCAGCTLTGCRLASSLRASHCLTLRCPAPCAAAWPAVGELHTD